MKIVAVTACPTGIAHTYMAAARLESTAKKLGHQIKVETQGALGIENKLTAQDIREASVVLLAVDIEIEERDRFNGVSVVQVALQDVLKDATSVFAKLSRDVP